MGSQRSPCKEQPCASRQQRAPRRGFSLIELLVALVLLEIGLLALVGMTAASARATNGSRRDATALSVAWARLERAASLTCRGSSSGVFPAGPGLTEWYTETVGPNETRVISDSVVVATTFGIRSTVLRIGARC